MNRKHLFLACIVLAILLQLHGPSEGSGAGEALPLFVSYDTQSWVAFSLLTVFKAYLLPAALPVVLLERYAFEFEPWTGALHWTATVFFMAAAATTFWLFPWGRVEQMAGVHDPFQKKDRPSSRLLRGLAWISDAINKLKFGREKTSGWAFLDMVSSRFNKNDYFAGRMAWLGRFGTLCPCGVPSNGIAVTVGKPGSGKSTTAAINAVIMHNGPVIAIDGKGEIAQRCYAARGAGGGGVEGRGDRTFAIDPVGISGLPQAHYNPLTEIEREKDSDKQRLLIFKLVEGLIKSCEGENKWVYDEARSFAIGLIAYVLTVYPSERRTLLTMRRLLMEGDRSGLAREKAAANPSVAKLSAFDFLIARMKGAAAGPLRDLIAGRAMALEEMGEKQRGSVLSALKDATEWLDLEQYQRATATCDFLLSDFQEDNITVFVCVPLNHLATTANGFVRLFVTLFMNTMYGRREMPKGGPVLCLADEFPQLGYSESWAAIGPTMRDYGVKMWIFLQDLGQIRALYKDWETFIGCAAMVQYFSVHHGETLDYMVRSLGEQLIKERQPDGRIVKRPYPLLDRVQAARYLEAKAGNVIIVPYGSRPMRLKTAPYWKYLPYWRYTPDPRHPEPALRRWMRSRAIERETQRTVGNKGKVAKPA